MGKNEFTIGIYIGLSVGGKMGWRIWAGGFGLADLVAGNSRRGKKTPAIHPGDPNSFGKLTKI